MKNTKFIPSKDYKVGDVVIKRKSTYDEMWKIVYIDNSILYCDWIIGGDKKYTRRISHFDIIEQKMNISAYNYICVSFNKKDNTCNYLSRKIIIDSIFTMGDELKDIEKLLAYKYSEPNVNILAISDLLKNLKYNFPVDSYMDNIHYMNLLSLTQDYISKEIHLFNTINAKYDTNCLFVYNPSNRFELITLRKIEKYYIKLNKIKNHLIMR